MSRMVSSARTRKDPTERRQEILRQAASIALERGLECVTLRAVAEPLGVRASLVHHYFSSAEALVVAAFELAISGEREVLFSAKGTPTDRLATLIRRVQDGAGDELARFWLNARNLSRFRSDLALALAEQESLDRRELVGLLDDGVAVGEFACSDTLGACVRIFTAIDGRGAYVNNLGEFHHPAYVHFVTDVAAWAVGVPVEELRARVAAVGVEGRDRGAASALGGAV